jgi:hypothetical protein
MPLHDRIESVQIGRLELSVMPLLTQSGHDGFLAAMRYRALGGGREMLSYRRIRTDNLDGCEA